MASNLCGRVSPARVKMPLTTQCQQTHGGPFRVSGELACAAFLTAEPGSRSSLHHWQSPVCAERERVPSVHSRNNGLLKLHCFPSIFVCARLAFCLCRKFNSVPRECFHAPTTICRRDNKRDGGYGAALERFRDFLQNGVGCEELLLITLD